MTPAQSAENNGLICRERAADDLGQAVRLFTRADPAWTFKRVAGEAGIAYGRMQDLMANDPGERRHATLAEALSIWAVIGTCGASISLARIGMVAEPEEEATGAIARTGARLTMAAARLMEKAADDEIAVDEAEDVLREAHDLMALAGSLIAAAEKAKRKGGRR